MKTNQWDNCSDTPEFVEGSLERVKQLIKMGITGLQFWQQAGAVNAEKDCIWCPGCKREISNMEEIAEVVNLVTSKIKAGKPERPLGTYALCEHCSELVGQNEDWETYNVKHQTPFSINGETKITMSGIIENLFSRYSKLKELDERE